MTFRRTSDGLRNQPVFFESDIVVYIEGVRCEVGPVHKIDDPREDDDGPASQDGLFWNVVLGVVLPDVRVHFKELGSKTSLVAFASGLDERVEGKLLVCADRDLDEILGRYVDLKYVVTTYRYSWEADIWVWVVFCSMLQQLSPFGAVPKKILGDARRARDRFFRRAAKFVRLDTQTALVRDIACFLPRESPGALIVASGDGVPLLNSKLLAKRAVDYRRRLERPWRPGVSAKFSSKTHFFGKVVNRYHCLLACYCLKRMGLPASVPSYIFQNCAIRALSDQLRAQSRARQLNHYRESIVAALS